jgi:hypothetical protein
MPPRRVQHYASRKRAHSAYERRRDDEHHVGRSSHHCPDVIPQRADATRPEPGAMPSISAADALAAAGGASASDETPTALLGRLTVSDYARGTVAIINHRLVWLVLYHHAPIALRGCRGPRYCPPAFDMKAIPVDARTGKSLGDWEWSGGA